MHKKIQRLHLLFFLFGALQGFSQFTTILDSNILKQPIIPVQLAHFGNTTFIQTSNNTPYVLQSDGTKDGTQLIDFDPNQQQYLQVDEDRCIRITINYTEVSTIIHLFTPNQNQPITYTLDNFLSTDVKLHHNKLILHRDSEFIVLDLENGNYLKKEFTELKPFTSWIPWNDYIVFSGDDENIYKVLIEDLTFSLAFQTDVEYSKQLIPFNDSLFLFISSDRLFAANISSNQFLTEFPATSPISITTLTIDNSLYFSFIPSTSSNFVLHIIKTNGAPDGTSVVPTTSVSPFSNKIDLFQLKNKLFFHANDSLWTSDGTPNGTHTLFDYRAIKPYYSTKNSNGYFFFTSLDWTGIQHPCLFDGNNVFRIESDYKDQANYPKDYYPNEYIGKNNTYLPLCDINYGRELHRFNYSTKATTMIADFTPNANWSDIRPIGEINNHLLLAVTQGFKTKYLSVADSLSDVTPAPILKNYNWSENITSFQSIKKELGVVDSNGNYYTSIHTSAPKQPTNLLYNRITLDTLQPNKIIKLSNQGEYIWSMELPDNKGLPIQLAMNANDEIVLGMVINNNVQFSGQVFNSENGNLLLTTLNQDGQVQQAKQFPIGLNGQIDDIAINKENQIFITGKYSGKKAQFDQHTVKSERNIATFLIQMDSNGKVLWANAYPLPHIWPIDKKVSPITLGKNQVYFLQRTGSQQRLTECEGTKHRFRINAVQQSTGKTIWTKEIVSKDYSFPIDLAASQNEQLTIIGSYMDEIQFDNTTLASDSCNQTNFFMANYDAQGQFLKVDKLAQNYQFLTQVEYDKKGSLYTIGTVIDSSYFGINVTFDSTYWNLKDYSHQIITLSKYDPLFHPVNAIALHQNTNNSNYHGYYLDISPNFSLTTNNEIVLSCLPKGMIDTFNILYTAPQRSLFLLQFDLDDSQNLTLDGHINATDIFLTPNPVNDHLNITSTDIDFTKASVIIYAMDGKQWDLPKNKNHGLVKFDTSPLPSGTYVAAIRFGDKVLAQKFIKIE